MARPLRKLGGSQPAQAAAWLNPTPLARPVLFQRVLAGVPFALGVVDADLRLRWANERFLSFVQEGQRADPAAAPLADVLEDALRPLAELAAQALSEHEALTAGEWEHHTDRGSSTWRWLLLPLELPGLELAPEPEEVAQAEDVSHIGQPAGEPSFQTSDALGVRSGLLAVAIDISDQVEMRRRSEELAFLSQQRTVELEATFRALTEAVVIFDADMRTVYANPAAQRSLGLDPLVTGQGDPVAMLAPRLPNGSALAPEELPAARALRGEIVEREKISLSTDGGELRTFMLSAAPVVVAGEIRGGVSVAQDVTEFERLMTERREAARLARALNRINLTLTSILDREEIMRRLVVEAAEALGAESSTLDVKEGAGWYVRHTHGLGEPLPRGPFSEEDVPFARRAARSQHPIAVEDADTDPVAGPELQRRHDVRSVLLVPLVVRGDTAALLFFNYHSKKKTFSEAELEFAEGLGTVAGIALENASLYHAERTVARILQRALLTVPPRLAGVEYGHLHRSATVGAEVGGDFYDLWPLVDRRVGVLIGDVSGKGVEASTLAALAKNATKAYLHEGIGPGQVLAKANHLLLEHSPAGTFVTAFLGVLDLHSGNLRYSFAGHPPAVLKRADGSISQLESGALILGLFPEASYREEELVLRPQDVLLLYTDGLTEARRDERFLGEDAVFDFFRRHPDLRASEVPSHLFEEALAFARGQLRDDLALLALSLAPDAVTD